MASDMSKTIRKAEEHDAKSAQLQGRSLLLFVTLASIGDAVITTDSMGGVTFLNPVAQDLTGWSLEDAVGVDIEEVFRVVDESTGKEIPHPVRQSLATVGKVDLPADVMLIRKDGMRIPVDDSAAPIMGMDGEVLGTVLVFRDVTERKKAEKMIKYRSELDRMAARISTAFITSPVWNVNNEIDAALKNIGEFLQADHTYVYMFDKDATSMRCTNEWRAKDIANSYFGQEMSTDVTPYWSRKIFKRECIYISESSQIPKNASAERKLWVEKKLQTYIAVPMYVEDRVLGFIGMESVREARPWPEEAVNLLFLIGDVFANAIARRDALMKLEAAREREVEIGARIQQTLLLSEPPHVFANYEVSALTIPSRGIDGDFYDFLQHPNQCLDVIFGDVMGKGVPAALLAAGGKTEFLRSLSHLLAGSPRGTIPQPQDIVNGVHRVLTPHLINLESFITLSYARFDSKAGKVTVVDCGNTRLIKCDAETGSIEYMSGYNLPLGFELSETYTEAVYNYNPGDVFVFYSDGVTEARNRYGEMFGIKRLKSLISKSRDLSSPQIVESIREAVTGFVGAGSFTDDFTCVVIKVIPEIDSEAVLSFEETEVSSDLTKLPDIRAFLRDFCLKRQRCKLSGYELNLLELAATEVASNIMKHSYHGEGGKPIWVRLELTAEDLKIRLSHIGDPFVGPDRIRLPSIKGSKEGGFGLFIINKVADSVEYSVDNMGRQYIELTRKLKTS